MKNIHILSTEKPSRLSDCHDNKLHLDDVRYLRNYKNIYITSDEEIKEGDWVVFNELEIVKCTYSKNGEFLFSEPLTSSSNHHFSYFKKIILTTDQDLIEDGVQPIPDEFLEWFVKNSSCERVKVNRFVSGKYFCTNPIISKEETKPKTMLESLQEYFKNTSKEKVLEDWNQFQHLDKEGITVKEFLENQKQETLEEFSRRRFNEQKLDTYTSYNIEDAIKEGVKWQQEQEQNNENSWFNEYQEVEDYIIKRIGDKFLEATPEKYNTASEATIALLENNWQQERMYSEEEVLEIIDSLFHRYASSFRIDAKEYFLQFKKK